MRVMYALIIAWSWSGTSAAGQTRKCCPSGYHINPLVTCTDKLPTALREVGSLDHEDICVADNATKNDTPGRRVWPTQLPTCPSHSMTVTCSNSTLHPSDVCPGENCGDEACWGEFEGSVTHLSCPCQHGVCVRKCCGLDQIFHASEGVCVSNKLTTDWAPQGLSSYTLLIDSLPPKCETLHLLKIYDDFNSHSRCFSKLQLENRNRFTFTDDGSVIVNKYKFSLDQESYCGDHTIHENGEVILNNLLVCLPEDSQARPKKFDVYGVLLIIGGCFLFLTVVVSCCLPELWGTFYHKVAICHNVSLMIASFTWGITNLLPAVSYHTCVVLSLVIQVTFLSSFFWMNVMCIDIALAFKTLRSVYGPAVDKGWVSLMWYSLYAWGFPILLTGVTATMELAPFVPEGIPRPGFGCKNCGFDPDTYAILIYFYGPMIFVLVFNFILFVMTLLKIRSVEKQTAIVKSTAQLRSSQEIQKVVLFTKMFVLMGLTWGTEVIGWWVGGPAVVWYLPDLINFLRALFLCFLFIGKRSVVIALKQKIKRNPLIGGDTKESRFRRTKSTSVERKEQNDISGRLFTQPVSQNFRRISADSHV